MREITAYQRVHLVAAAKKLEWARTLWWNKLAIWEYGEREDVDRPTEWAAVYNIQDEIKRGAPREAAVQPIAQPIHMAMERGVEKKAGKWWNNPALCGERREDRRLHEVLADRGERLEFVTVERPKAGVKNGAFPLVAAVVLPGVAARAGMAAGY